MQKLQVGQAMMGSVAPAEGYQVEVSMRQLASESFAASLLDWLRTSVHCRFTPGNPVKVDIQIRG